VLVAAGIACAAAHGSLFPVLNGLAVARTPPRLHGSVVSLYTAALDGGAVLGTPLCGVLAHAVGYRLMFATMAVGSVGGLLLMLYDRRRLGRAAAACVAVAVLAAPAIAADWPDLASGPLQDNSFLIEEAYNQERGVVQHIVNAVWNRKNRDWRLTFTQEWPVPDQTNQLSFTVPYLFAGSPMPRAGRRTCSSTTAIRPSRRRRAARRSHRALSLVLPTGSTRDELGNGSPGFEVALP
jgi:MFS family permease